MIELFKESLGNQFEAAFCTLGVCVDRCPKELWDGKVFSLKFNQVAFHVLIFSDLYLGKNMAAIFEQPFHKQHADVFAQYEEFEDRVQQQCYEKEFILEYLAHCRSKAHEVITAETIESLNRRPGFDLRPYSRCEVHQTNLRHLHHHAAQLSLTLRSKASIDIPWIASGWRTDLMQGS